MATVRLETESITDWQSFHAACQHVFGFPDFYGMNMDAWIDCLSYLDEDSGMTRFNLAKGEKLHIEVTSTESFNRRLPEIFGALVECSAFVNRGYVDDGGRARRVAGLSLGSVSAVSSIAPANNGMHPTPL